MGGHGKVPLLKQVPRKQVGTACFGRSIVLRLTRHPLDACSTPCRFPPLLCPAVNTVNIQRNDRVSISALRNGRRTHPPTDGRMDGGPKCNNAHPKQTGIWTLVYSSSQAFRSSPFFATFQALLGREGVAEKIFSFTDAFPNAKIGQARQIINNDCTELLSRVEMSVWPHR